MRKDRKSTLSTVLRTIKRLYVKHERNYSAYFSQWDLLQERFDLVGLAKNEVLGDFDLSTRELCRYEDLVGSEIIRVRI